MRDAAVPQTNLALGQPDPWRLLEHAPGLLFVLAPEGTVTRAFRATHAALGVSAADVLGKRLWECPCWKPWAEARTLLREAVARAADGQDQRLNAPAQVADNLRWLDLTLLPVPNDAGQVEYLTVSANDITERRRAQALVQRLAQQRQLALDAAKLGWWQYDPITRIAEWDDGYKAIFGVTGYTRPNDEILKQIIHPEDLPGLWAKVEAALSPADPQVFATEYRINRPDGQMRWVEAHGIATFEGEGDARRAVNFVGTVQDITERKATEEALLEADRRKNRFLAVLAHELRNPLAPIRSAVQVLKLRGSPDPTERRVQDIIDRQLAHLARLVDDLLDVSRITHGKLKLRTESIELTRILDQAIETTRHLPECQGVNLSVALPAEPIYLEADPVRLTQVFANLLHNACKFTPEGGRVRVGAERAGAQVVVRVEDSGIGISREGLPGLFELFSQDDAAPADKPGGLGIGLSLVKGLVELHGGSVEVRSEGPGSGAEFTVRLPARATSGRAQERPAPEPVSARRILVVDDIQDNVESLAILLRACGHEVETAQDGLAALARTVRFRPEVVLLDIGMPGMDGYEVCRRLRAQPWGRDLIILALTGWGQEEDQRRTREAGFDGHLVKPVDLADLSERLASLSGATGGKSAHPP